MFRRTLMLVAFAGLLGLVGAVSTQADTARRMSYLTFSGAVALPGVRLNAGTYTFEIADPAMSTDIVRVSSRDRKIVYFIGFTERTYKPAGWPDTRQISFGEAQKGMAPPILAWYPAGATLGYRFKY